MKSTSSLHFSVHKSTPGGNACKTVRTSWAEYRGPPEIFLSASSASLSGGVRSCLIDALYRTTMVSLPRGNPRRRGRRLEAVFFQCSFSAEKLGLSIRALHQRRAPTSSLPCPACCRRAGRTLREENCLQRSYTAANKAKRVSGYSPANPLQDWWRFTDSNRGPVDYDSSGKCIQRRPSLPIYSGLRGKIDRSDGRASPSMPINIP